jgi:hypothetical protein
MKGDLRIPASRFLNILAAAIHARNFETHRL